MQFLDLSRLRFDLETIEDVQGLTFPNLKSLVLGKCTLPPVKLAIISRTFPELNSLVFRGSVLNIPETFLNNTFSNIIKLNLAYCRICDFDDLAQLSNFENLAELKLCNNPIGKIEYRSGFLKLKKINVEGTQLVDLVSASQLNIFPSLTEIRMGNTPLSQRLGEHLRKVLMAYLQKATKINGGYIDAKERANHERQFIRDFSEPGNLNEHVTNIEYIMKLLGFHLDEQELEVNKNIFQILLKTHGTVHKFAEVNLAPPTIANLIFETEDGRKEVKEVPLGWKVVNLKKLCQNLFNIPQAKQKLYYLDHELPIYGMELLRFDNKVLWTLKMKDNDVILVRVR